MNLRKMSIDNVSLNSLSGVEVDLHIEWDLTELAQNVGGMKTDNGGYRFTGHE